MEPAPNCFFLAPWQVNLYTCRHRYFKKGRQGSAIAPSREFKLLFPSSSPLFDLINLKLPQMNDLCSLRLPHNNCWRSDAFVGGVLIKDILGGVPIFCRSIPHRNAGRCQSLQCLRWEITPLSFPLLLLTPPFPRHTLTAWHTVRVLGGV